MPASRRRPTLPVASAVASSDWTRESAPYAICDWSSRVGSRPLSGPPEVSIHGVKPAESLTAGAR